MRVLKPLPGILPMPGHPLADAVGLWPFNSLGNKVFDLSGNGNGMDFVNSPIWTTGNIGHTILFNGLNQLLHRGDTCGIVSYPFSMVCWFYVDDNSNNQTLMGFCDTDNADDYHMLWLRDLPDVDVVCSTLHVGGANAFSAKSFSLNTWHMATGVWAGAQDRRVYLDGGNEGINIVTNRTWPDLIDNFTIGARRLNSLDSNFVSGKISMGMIYNRALSASEIALLYREPFCMFPENIMPEFGIAA